MIDDDKNEDEHCTGLGYRDASSDNYSKGQEQEQQQQQQQQQESSPRFLFVPATLVLPQPKEEKDQVIASDASMTKTRHVDCYNTTNTSCSTNRTKDEILESSVEKAKDIVRRIMVSRDATSSRYTSRMDVAGNDVAGGWPRQQLLPVPPQQQQQRLSDTSTSYPYAQKRHEFLTGHCQKLHNYYLQNLNYLAKLDEAKLQQQVNHLQFIKDKYTAQPLQQQPQPQPQLPRRKRLFTCMAGIGNRQQKKFQKQFQKTNGMIKSSSSSLSCNGRCCGIYVSGLSRNNENNDNHDSHHSSVKDLLMQLFSSFGKISNVKLYRDKGGELKGDGLVVYDWNHVRKEWMSRGSNKGDTMEAMDEFLNMVCLQVSVF
jgi:hypothetical protein